MQLNYFRLAAHRDPLAEASNTIALVLASNTPFYPLYLYFILGRSGLPWILLPAASLPFFCAPVWISRRSSLWGRICLCVVAISNTLYATWLLGESSGTALFLIPCISLAVLSFRRREKLPMAVLTALPYGLYYFLHRHFPAPPATYSPTSDASLVTLNGFSVAAITAVLAYVFAEAHRKEEVLF